MDKVLDKCEWCGKGEVDDSLKLVTCLHGFCRGCLAESFGLDGGDDAGFKCPVAECPGILSPEEVLQVLEGPKRKKRTREDVAKEVKAETIDLTAGGGTLSEDEDVFGKCSWCEEPCAGADVIVLEKCVHLLCRNCVKMRLIAEEGVAVRCPLVEVTGCEGVLVEHEIKRMVSEEEFNKWLDRSMAGVENVVTCGTPGCGGSYFVEEGRRAFQCGLCGRQNCVKCKTVHEDLSCEKYKELLGKSKEVGETVDALMEAEGRSGWMQVQQMVKDQGVEVLDVELIVTIDSIECTICFSLIPRGDGVILHDCLHTYCKGCLVNVIKNSEVSEVKCPFGDGQFGCQNALKPREIKALVSEQEVDRLLSKAALVAEGVTPNAFHCLTLNCPGWIEVASTQVKSFRCFVCDKNNCIVCKIIHEGSCADYKKHVNSENKSESTIQKLIRQKKAKQCPRCNRLIIKNGGCDHMRCAVCRHNFSWSRG